MQKDIVGDEDRVKWLLWEKKPTTNTHNVPRQPGGYIRVYVS